MNGNTKDDPKAPTNYGFLFTMVIIELILILSVFIGERIYKSKYDKALDTSKELENKNGEVYVSYETR